MYKKLFTAFTIMLLQSLLTPSLVSASGLALAEESRRFSSACYKAIKNDDAFSNESYAKALAKAFGDDIYTIVRNQYSYSPSEFFIKPQRWAWVTSSIVMTYEEKALEGGWAEPEISPPYDVTYKCLLLMKDRSSTPSVEAWYLVSSDGDGRKDNFKVKSTYYCRKDAYESYFINDFNKKCEIYHDGKFVGQREFVESEWLDLNNGMDKPELQSHIYDLNSRAFRYIDHVDIKVNFYLNDFIK